MDIIGWHNILIRESGEFRLIDYEKSNLFDFSTKVSTDVYTKKGGNNAFSAPE